MKIKQFALQLEQKENPSPLMQILQDLRKITVARAEPADPVGWNPWMDGGQAPLGQTP
jgi:D-hexose-6-phosphate mutarotase